MNLFSSGSMLKTESDSSFRIVGKDGVLGEKTRDF
jgi:hypothetical protein